MGHNAYLDFTWLRGLPGKGVGMDFVPKDYYTIQDLLEIIVLLRAPGGCPWDREQTHKSIRANLIEETYEVAEAIDLADTALLREELGDLLLQIVLHTRMEEELGHFTFDDVCDELCKKLVYRHPHVFGELTAQNASQALQNWEALKNTEKGRLTAADRLTSVPGSLPALMQCTKVQKRADAFGFAYPGVSRAIQDLEDEIAELKAALASGENVPGEVGDVLFSAANVARLAGAEAEQELAFATKRFVSRVVCAEEMAAEKGKALQEVSEAELDELWRLAKSCLAEK